jgi:hypothetical protein
VEIAPTSQLQRNNSPSNNPTPNDTYIYDQFFLDETSSDESTDSEEILDSAKPPIREDSTDNEENPTAVNPKFPTDPADLPAPIDKCNMHNERHTFACLPSMSTNSKAMRRLSSLATKPPLLAMQLPRLITPISRSGMLFFAFQI